MKARKLKALLNNTSYIIGDYGDYIAVGSDYVHKLINIDKKTLEMRYALGSYRNSTPDSPELMFIWSKLVELIDNGQIKDIIEGEDVIENPLPVFYVEDGIVIETQTDKYGWPNTTKEGYVMSENVYFKTKSQAIKQAIKEYGASLTMFEEQLQEREKDVLKLRQRIDSYISYIDGLQLLKLDA
jgi:hypothetical protein